MTLTGPELLFTAPAVFAVSGAPVSVTIDGEEKPMWSRLTIHAGQKLKIGKVENGGLRFYLAVKGGFPEVCVAHKPCVIVAVLTNVVPRILDQKQAPRVLDLVAHRDGNCK